MKYLLYTIAGIMLGLAIGQRKTVVNETHVHYDYTQPQPIYPITPVYPYPTSPSVPYPEPWKPTIICQQTGAGAQGMSLT